MILENNLVSLRFMTEEDTDKIIAWRNSPVVMKRFLYRKPLTREDHLSWIHNRIESGEVVQFVIVIKDSRQEIGSTYLRDINHATKEAEFGIFIGESANGGHGYGSAAQQLTLRYAYENLGLKLVRARILADNEASIRMHLKNGFLLLPEKTEEMELDGEMKKVVFLEHRQENSIVKGES